MYSYIIQMKNLEICGKEMVKEAKWGRYRSVEQCIPAT